MGDVNNLFEVIIGIENHIELKTVTKMFSCGWASFNNIPNSMVNNVDMGYPGMMPTVNKKCIELALIMCKVLNLKINSLIQFDRKHYYYPDLPKGFQITQYYFPIGVDGYLIIKDENDADFKVEIDRLHIEEDTAKQIHDDEYTLLDYNRAGIGLIEIVTKPVLRSVIQVKNYLKNLKEILIYTQVSNANMSEGSLRCDINISLRPFGSKKTSKKVEIKNLNSISNIEKAINYEIKRQSKIILNGQLVGQETRRFDEKLGITVLMRKKNNLIDYCYFPEPNILPIKLEKKWIELVLNNIPELPDEKRKRYLYKYNLKKENVEILLQNYSLACFFDSVIKYNSNYEIILNYLLKEIRPYLNEKSLLIDDTKLTPFNLSKLIDLIVKNVISIKQSKIILKRLFEDDKIVPQKLVKIMELKQIVDYKEIENIIIPVIKNNFELLKLYETRKERVIKFFMGKLMRLTNGQVSPKIGRRVIINLVELEACNLQKPE